MAHWQLSPGERAQRRARWRCSEGNQPFPYGREVRPCYPLIPLYVVLTGAGQLSKPLEYNKLQVMGSSAESDQHNKRNLLPGIKSTTEQTPTNRNNTSDMLPENNTGKDVEITERTQDLKGTKQYRTPNNKMRTSKAPLDNYPTNKVDPTIGSTRRENRDRNPVGKPEIPLTKLSRFSAESGKPGSLRSPGVLYCQDCSPKWLSLTRCCYSVQSALSCITRGRVRIRCPLVCQTRLISGSLAFSAQFTFSVDFSCALPLAML